MYADRKRHGEGLVGEADGPKWQHAGLDSVAEGAVFYISQSDRSGEPSRLR